MAENERLILLVEDNVEDERATLRALRRQNVMNEVVVACTGAEALAYLDSHRHGAPDLIVLDYGLPDLTGLEALTAIRASESARHVPVVIFSGLTDPSTMAACYAAGANSYVVKPNSLHEFSEAILQISMYWLLVNRAPTRQSAGV